MSDTQTTNDLLKQLVKSLAPKQQNSAQVIFDPTQPALTHNVRTKGRTNQFLVSLRSNCQIDCWLNCPSFDPNSNSRPRPDFTFSGPTGNPIPIPFYENADTSITFATNPLSVQPPDGSIFVCYY